MIENEHDEINRVAAVQIEADKLATLKKDLQEGLDDIAAGKVSELGEVFARLKTQFPDETVRV